MPTDKKTIDAYNRHAASWVKSRQDGDIFHLYLEKPAMYSKLPDLHDKTVLCIGCGTGEEVEYLHSLGAKKVIGTDISEGLIAIAKKQFPTLEFHVMDTESLEFPEESFDFVYASLMMHYLKNWNKALTSVGRILKPGGIFLFSTMHPFLSGSKRYEDEKVKSRILGYERSKEDASCEIYGDYFTPQPFDVKLSEALTVSNNHRPLNELIKDILHSDFELIDIVEPKAVDAAKEKHTTFWEIHQKIPEFMIFELRKKFSTY